MRMPLQKLRCFEAKRAHRNLRCSITHALGIGLMLVMMLATAEKGKAAETEVKQADLDPSTFAESIGGQEAALFGAGQADRPEWVLWTQTTQPGHTGRSFGNTQVIGSRHLRLGFKRPIAVGSILMMSDARLSVLKPEVPYPGNLNDDSQWISAQRVESGSVARAQAPKGNYCLWVLPEVTKTRAIRLTHESVADDTVFAGWVGGVYLLTQRFGNAVAQASISASSQGSIAEELARENASSIWSAWANVPLRSSDRQRTIAEKPEWIMLYWRQPKEISGVGFFGAGFAAAEIQRYRGPLSRPPEGGADADWETIGATKGLKNQYPRVLPIDWVSFAGRQMVTAIRVRITATTDESHPHMKGMTGGGRRVWLGGLIALEPLDRRPLSAPLQPDRAAYGPIKIDFELPAASEVTLVIDDSAGKRVRNLISAEPLPAGHNSLTWDGYDDLGRDLDAAAHGIYSVPPHIVAPGTYTVRGLWHKPLDLVYEFSVNSPGNPPWPTEDLSGGWTTNHSPPSSVLFVPATAASLGQPLVYIGSYVAEGGSALAWADLDGNKLGGKRSVGGSWTGAQFLACDSGPRADPSVCVYASAAFSPDSTNTTADIRMTAISLAGADRSIPSYHFVLPAGVDAIATLDGMAVRDGLLIISQKIFNRLVAIDTKTGKTLGSVQVADPRGIAFDAKGRLVVLSEHSLLRYVCSELGAFELGASEEVAGNLDEPTNLTIDHEGYIYIAERGHSHQVLKLSPEGRVMVRYGAPGPPAAGKYRPEHMNNPRGLTVDSRGRLWVAEEDFQPKRVSVWGQDGELEKAFYGPPRYGGGGSIDPQDRTLFDYDGMEFKLDWASGSSHLNRIFYRVAVRERPSNWFDRSVIPRSAIYLRGQRFFTNAFGQNPTNGTSVAFLFRDQPSGAIPVAAMGWSGDWPALRRPEFSAQWSEFSSPGKGQSTEQAFFIWNDLNGDGRPEPAEVTLHRSKVQTGGVTVMRDGTFALARSNFKAAGESAALLFRPASFDAAGIPRYDFQSAEAVLRGANLPLSTGGDQIVAAPDGWTIFTTAPRPFSPAGLAGVKNGIPQWSYPSLWPGLHASHNSPIPDSPGELIGTTRLLGDMVTPPNSAAGPMFFLNGNQGSIYAFTSDGLFVSALGRDRRLGKPWSMPQAIRGMLLNQISPGEEHFYPTVNQLKNGEIYLVSGHIFSAVVRVDHLETVHRFAPWSVSISEHSRVQSAEAIAQREMNRQSNQSPQFLYAPLASGDAPSPYDLKHWPSDAWVEIDHRGTAAYIDSRAQPYSVQGSLGVVGQNLVALWNTYEPALIENRWTAGSALFQSGGGLDLLIGTDPRADPHRNHAVEGDLRLVTAKVGGRIKAMLYRPIHPGASASAHDQFSSPWRTIDFDEVKDVSASVKLMEDHQGGFQLTLPLSLIGLAPTPGMRLKADIGVLRGKDGETQQRVCWSNKETAVLADLPSEAQLVPGLWGNLIFRPSP